MTLDFPLSYSGSAINTDDFKFAAEVAAKVPKMHVNEKGATLTRVCKMQ